MEQQTKIKVPGLGVVTVDFVECDGCAMRTTEDNAINWVVVQPFGKHAQTMAQDSPSVLHYCGSICLRGNSI